MEFLHPAMWHDHESWQWIHQVAAPCNVIRGSGIITLNSPDSNNLHCSRWLWDDMLLNSLIRTPYWNSTSGIDFDHIIAVDMSFCTSLDNFIRIRPPLAEKNDVMSILKMADLSHLGVYGSHNGFFENPNYITSYRSSHSSKLHSFWENRVFFPFWRQTNKQTNRQRWTAPMHFFFFSYACH